MPSSTFGPEAQSKDRRGQTVVDAALQTGFLDVRRNSAPFAPRTLLHNPPRDVGAGYDRFDSSASTKRLNPRGWM